MIDIVFYSDEIPGIDSEFFVKAIPLIVENEKREMGEITIVICTDEELLELNKKHLNHDYYTDIITFDYCELNIISGDLFISFDRIIDNASLHFVEIKEELCRVIFHGVLHLIGYNDKTEDEVMKMRQKEKEYLDTLFHVKP